MIARALASRLMEAARKADPALLVYGGATSASRSGISLTPWFGL